jgi:Trk-type K+ transport system membrane component
MVTLRFLWWFCWEEGDGNNVVAFLYGGDIVKKAMVACDFFFCFFSLVLLVLFIKIDN